MNDVDPCQAYLNLADEFLTNRISGRDLSNFTLHLPPLDEIFLNEVGQRAEKLAITNPRRGWALTTVAYSATKSQNQCIFIQSMAAWYLGRASNHWGQPKRVKIALSQARRGFVRLDEPGWIAACDWQFYALPWTRTDIPRAGEILIKALDKLQHKGFEEFVPHCRLTLAYAQLLVGIFDEAKSNIQASETAFIAAGDRLNRARCWSNEASCLRREGRIDEAKVKLNEALPVFEAESSSLDVAKTYYQIALCHLLRVDDLPQATNYFNKAIELFRTLEMDLWQAMCTNDLGYVYLLIGSLEKANNNFEEARNRFTHHKVLGLLADNLNDNGKLNTLRGYPTISIEQFKQAEIFHEKLDLKLASAIDAANLGEAYGFVGRYQDALYHLERAIGRFKSFNNFLRLESSEKFIAIVWSQLGNLESALDHLSMAAVYHEKSSQKKSFSSIYNLRAGILLRQNKYSEAIDHLKMSLDAATTFGVRPQAALARRLLGEVLSRTGGYSLALEYLRQAYSDFVEMGMVMEQAATLVALGIYYSLVLESEKAREAFDNALQLSEGTMPETDWRAYAGLATLAEARGDVQAEFSSYRDALTALTKIRNNFWQPVLAGSYLQAPSVVIDKAIIRSATIRASHDALKFIEQNKATTLLTQLEMSTAFVKTKESQGLAGILSELHWLQDRLRVSFDATNPIMSAVQSRNIRSRLTEKMKQYDTVTARLERQNYVGKEPAVLPNNFNLSIFRSFANEAIGKSWVAVDYYMTDDVLITLLITPDDCKIFTSPISHRITMALESCANNKYPITPSQSDLCVLGDFLIPASVAKLLEPDIYLLLAPHKKLHSIPWAAVQPSFTSKPLVSSCIPNVVPSLQSLCVFWGRRKSVQKSNCDNGLVIGVSSFHGVKIELPHVKDEIAALGTRLGTAGKLLSDDEATWENVRRFLIGEKSTNLGVRECHFSWLHVSTHFSADPRSGRLSGITLWDGDVWLDQLRDLTPLPNLVTFSGCNSVFSFLYQGDEHMDLPSTCFVSGANSVVGSVWPVEDESAANFTISFYENLLKGLSPAQSVAHTQRRIIKQSKDITAWASFMCIGVP